jgi:hypothetical protein
MCTGSACVIAADMTASERLATLEPACTMEQALALFDSSSAVRAETITGRWKGRELTTGHPLDGLLAASGWYGKQFDGLDAVHPLLMTGAGGRLFALDPRWVRLGLLGRVPPALVTKGRWLLTALEPFLRTDKPRARLRNLEHRGVVTAAMLYDQLPIIDVFRRVDDDRLLGFMELRGQPRAYFFILDRSVRD